MALEHVAEHGHEHEQQREEREEGVVGDQRGQPAGLVVGELLQHRERNREPAMPLLPAIEPADRAQKIHAC